MGLTLFKTKHKLTHQLFVSEVFTSMLSIWHLYILKNKRIAANRVFNPLLRNWDGAYVLCSSCISQHGILFYVWAFIGFNQLPVSLVKICWVTWNRTHYKEQSKIVHPSVFSNIPLIYFSVPLKETPRTETFRLKFPPILQSFSAVIQT